LWTIYGDFEMDFLDQLADALNKRSAQTAAPGTGTGLPFPKEITDPTVDAAVRASARSAFVARVTDHPSSSWSPAEKEAVRQEIDAVLKSM
jgi:hypothetical protein